MTTPAPSAPSIAPAAQPAGGGTPSWGGGSVAALLAGVTSDAPAPVAPVATPPAPTPVAPAPTVAAQPPSPATPTTLASPSPAEPAPEPAQPAEPENPELAAQPAAPEQPERLLAGRFKTANPAVLEDPGVQELTKAYHESGVEGRRLHAENKSLKDDFSKIQTDLQTARTELEMLNLEKELGPEVKDPTAEEMAAWSPAQVAKFYADKTKRDILKRQLDSDRKRNTEETQKRAKDNQTLIMRTVDQMAQDAEHFPDYPKLIPVVQDLMNMEPGLIGLPQSPLITYLAAYGHRALQNILKSKALTARAAEAAKLKAKVGLPAVAGAGGGGEPPPAPKPAAGPTPGSDAEHVANLLRTQVARKPVLPID